MNIFYRKNCLSIPQTICLDNGAHCVIPFNIPKSLVIWWTFDDNSMFDSSGNKVYGTPIPKAGPPRFIKGASAFFTGDYFTKVPNFSNLINKDMTISFWIYLLEDSTGNWRTLITKGNKSTELTPTIMLWPKERRLHVRVGTETFWNEGLESKSIIPLKQWTHVVVTFGGLMIQIFINGNKDNQIILNSKIKMNDGDFYIGKDLQKTGVKCYLDDFKIYDIVLNELEINQESVNSNLFIGSKYVVLGCESCKYIEALSSCDMDYHLCTYSELLAGGYLAARNNGIFKCNSDVWVNKSFVEKNLLNQDSPDTSDENDQDNDFVRKSALCCLNY